MVSVHDVAARLVQLQALQTRRGKGLASMSTSKLHKLAYFCQAYHLALHGEPMFDEEVLAAPSGPVVAELFPHHEDLFVVESWPAGDAGSLDKKRIQTVDALFSHYSYSSGRDLTETAQDHAPWVRAHGASLSDSNRPAISHEDMTSFYRALFDAPKTPEDYATRFMDRYRSNPVGAKL